MASTQREIRFNIKADASDAIKAVTDLGRTIDSQSGAMGDFNAQVFNDNIRRSVGVLGDLDTALQTLGSTMGIEGLQIVGDFFAIGEAVGQLAGAVPLLISGFAGLLPVLTPLLPILAPLALAAGAVAGAVHLLTQEYRDQQAEAERVAKATDAVNERLGNLGSTLDRMSAGELTDYVNQLEAQRDIIGTQLDFYRRLGIASVDLELAFYEVTQSMEQAVDAMDAAIFDQWADNVRDFSDLTEEEAKRQIDILEDRLAVEQTIYNEAVRLYGEQSEQAQEAARGIDEITASLEYMNSVDYSQTAANIEAMTAQANQNLGDLVGNLGGLFDKTKGAFGGFFEDVVEGATEAGKDKVEADRKAQDDAAKEYQAYLKEQARLREQQEREWQRKLEADKRNLEDQLDQIKRFEETRWRIENDFLTSRADAILENDVTALYEAKRTRRQARQEERMFGSTVVVNDLNVGAISRPEDIEAAKQMLLNALTATLSMQEGKYA